MSTHREEDLELCAGYALGALGEDDRRRIEAHLADGCAVCAAELARHEAATALLAQSAPRHRAPTAARARVLAAFDAETAGMRRDTAPPAPLPLPRPRSSAATWGWAMAAALLAVVGVVQWRAATRIQAELALARSERGRLERLLDEERSWATLPQAPGAVRVTLAATPAGAAGLKANVVYDPATRRALLVCENFTPPAGHDYELWAIRKGGPESLGLVHVDSGGHAEVRLTDAGDPATLGAFAVSLEQAGGAPTRTAPGGPVVMVGKIAG